MFILATTRTGYYIAVKITVVFAEVISLRRVKARSHALEVFDISPNCVNSREEKKNSKMSDWTLIFGLLCIALLIQKPQRVQCEHKT